MKVLIHTQRYGIQTDLMFHCDMCRLNQDSQLLTIYNQIDHNIPFETERVNEIIPITFIFLLETDIMNILDCTDKCPHPVHHVFSLRPLLSDLNLMPEVYLDYLQQEWYDPRTASKAKEGR